jgi:intein/homing endonuclease
MPVPQPQRPKGPGLSSLIRQAGQVAKAQVEQAVPVVAPVVGAKAIPKPASIYNVQEYIEQPWGLGMRLYPVQRFIVKLYYHLPLDDKFKTIQVTDMFRSKVLYSLTEKEYLRFLFSEGRCNIGEQDHERRELLLSLGRRAGKCVRGDTLVLTDQGILRIEDIGEAPEDGFVSSTVGVAQEGGRKAQSEAFYNGGVKQTYTVKTKSGYTVTGTGNHRIKVMTSSGRVEWCYLDELRPGDFVALNRNTDLWASTALDLRPFHNKDGYKDVQLPNVLDEKLGNLLGYLVGDGTWVDGHAVSITVEHPETWEHLRTLFTEVFGEPRVQMDKRLANTGRLEFCSVRARRFLDTLGWKLGCARDEKMIPWAILRSPRSVVCAFLRGLFETDGCAEKGGRHITFSTASFRLAHEVQVVLLNLGIVSNVKRKWVTKTKRHYAVLSLKGKRSRERFATLISFDSKKKRLPMLASLKMAQEGKLDTESIPHQRQRVRDWLESVPTRIGRRDGLGWGRTKLRLATGNVHKGSGEDLTYPKILRALDVARDLSAGVVETTHFENLLRLDYFYDAVVIVEKGEDQVYDLTVPDGESFVANGMTNHNTSLSGIFASYEVYRLLNLGHPQGHYGLPPGNRIQIISVATDKDQAGILFNEVTSHLSRCDYFKPYIANNTLSHIQFRTPQDITRYGETSRHENGKFVSFNGKATLRVTFKSCIAKGLRGSGNIVIILDEMAHFMAKGNSSAEDIYNAVTPSALAFSPKDPADTTIPIGPVESRIICISSPLNKTGKFFELYQLAMGNGPGSANMLAIQAPTWEVNPTVEPEFLRQKYHADPTTFMTEYGAQFSDRVRGWIEREIDLLDCIDPVRRPVESGLPRVPHSMGIDIGLVGDGTAIFITHVEGDKIILDYYEQWVAGVDWRVSNPHLGASYSTSYARQLKEVERLDFDEIGNWITQLTKRFYIVDAIFDRWNGIPLEQSLRKRGFNQFKSEFFTRDFASKIYQNAKMMMFDHRLVLFDWPRNEEETKSKHSPFIQELLQLQAEQLSKNLVAVQAPKQSGYHDDMSDAFVRSVWLSSQRMASLKYITSTSPSMLGMVPGMGGMSLARYQAKRAMSHGGYSERIVPKRIGLRLRGR